MPESNTRNNRRSREIEIVNHTSTRIDESPFRETIIQILDQFDVLRAEISIAMVDDDTIHQLNRRFLGHDHPTDVLAFPEDFEPDGILKGEVIASVDAARRVADQLSIAWTGELLLYVIHGLLHLLGQDDSDDIRAAEMRNWEKYFLEQIGYPYRFDSTST